MAPRIRRVNGVRPHSAAVYVLAFLVAGTMQSSAHEEWFRGLDLEPGLSEASLVLVGRVVDVSETRIMMGGKPIPLGSRITETDKLLKQDHRRVFSHCDLHPANIIWDGHRVWLVDWERAGPAHPYLDMAILSNFLTLPEADALGLVELQQQAPLDASQKLLFAARLAAKLGPGYKSRRPDQSLYRHQTSTK